MLKKLGIYLAIAALMVGLGAGTVWYHLSAKLAAKSAEIADLKKAQDVLLGQRKTDQALLARRAKKNAAIARSEALASQRLSQVLAAERAWADQPVPKEVQDVLEQP